MGSDFFSRVAALERSSGRRVGARHPSDEPVRFVPSVSLAFAPQDLETTTGDGPEEWTTAFLGLAGAEGALPPYLSEEIAREDPDRAARRTLLTPFHHRATALLFRSVHRCRIPDATQTRMDTWHRRMVALVCGEVRDPLDTEVALALAPLLHGPKAAASLARALRVLAKRWLGDAPIRLSERTGARVRIAADARSRLGATRLGDTALLGSTVEDPASRATIHVGPLADGYLGALAPGAPGHRALALVLRWLGGSATEIEVIVLQRDVPLRVGAARLGQTALGRHAGRSRERHLVLDATAHTPVRQGLTKDGSTPPSKEPSCDPIPARSSSA